MAKEKIVCKECGSEEVRRDAFASWDVDKQEWVLHAIYDHFVCDSDECNGEPCDIKTIEGKAGDSSSNDPFVASGSSESPALEQLAPLVGVGKN